MHLLSVISWAPLECHHLNSILDHFLALPITLANSDLSYARLTFFLISSVLISRLLLCELCLSVELHRCSICSDRVLDERDGRLFAAPGPCSFCALLPIAILIVSLTFSLATAVASLGADLFLIIIALQPQSNLKTATNGVQIDVDLRVYGPGCYKQSIKIISLRLQEMQLPDQGNELFQNIKEARLQLNKLKQEASALSADPYSFGGHNMRQYMKNVAYSLSKNDHNVDKKISEYKSKLPSIHRQEKYQLDVSLGGYRKYKKPTKQPSTKRASEESTKIENSFSLSVQNRPMKIHSNLERSYKPEYSQAEGIDSQLHMPAQFQKLKQEAQRLQKRQPHEKISSNSNHHRRHFSSQKKKMKYVDLNSSAIIQQANDLLRPPNELEYNDMVDKYSKHEFMIIHGKTASQGPEYASYARIYESIFGRIKSEIARIEEMLSQKSINFARFDGKKLAYLCLKDEIKKAQLVDCLVDETGKIRGLLVPASKFSGKKGKETAIIKIQGAYRMHLTRQKYLLLKQKTRIIQRFFRKNLVKLHLERRIHQRNAKIIQEFQRRQEQLQEQWRQIKKKKRIEIHMNSMEMDEEKRLSIQNFSQRENVQLSRIFRLKDDNVILIYVSSAELPSELINYYYKMLELAGIQKFQDRLLFFSPSNASRFPQHFSVSKLLYYSSKTLKQLKIITQDLPTLLFPGYPSNELIKICDILKCYLFSGAPQKMKPFTARSQTLNFVKNLSIPCLPSAMQMYDYGEFLNTFSVLIIKNPEIKTWVLKIDDEFGGRGIAYLDIGKSKAIQSIVSKIDYGNNQEFFTTDIGDLISEPQNQELTIRVRDYLRENLPQRLVIATPTMYRSYNQFMGRFIKKGGVIEAKPNMTTRQSFAFPSVSFCVDPLGELQIVASYDKIMGSPYRGYACTFPQQSIETKEAVTIIRQICQSFKIRSIFGYFTIDFLVVQDSAEPGSSSKIESRTETSSSKKNKIWVLDIDPYINNYTSSFYAFDALMGGSYFPQRNLYLVQKEDEKIDTFSVDTSSSQANANNPNSLVERYYLFIPHFLNQNMFKIKIRQFFKQARVERFNFDIGNKEGLCIMLLDALTSGTMSLMAVSRDIHEAITLTRSVLDFIVKMSDVKNVTYGKTDCEPSSDRILLKDMMNLFLTMARKKQKTNAKAKALKKFENNQDLDFII